LEDKTKKIKIFSAGASGTRFLKAAIEHVDPPNSNRSQILERDGPTHAPFNITSPKGINSLQKAIFLYADPRNVFLSICKKQVQRRHRHLVHLGYLGKRSKSLDSDIYNGGYLGEDISKALQSFSRNHKRTILVQSSQEAMTFQRLSIIAGNNTNALIGQLKSFSGLEDHFNSWLHAESPIPIAFVKYEYLPEVIEQIVDFISKETEVSLPWLKIAEYILSHWRPRASNYINHDCEAKLNQLFGPLIAIQKELPPFWIKEPTR